MDRFTVTIADWFVLLIVTIAILILFGFIKNLLRGRFRSKGYNRIKQWLRVRYGVRFTKGESNARIRTRLESVLESERSRLPKEEKMAEYGKKRRYKPPENRLKGFEAIIRKQDYSFLRE